MRTITADDLAIVVDTRERRPFSYPGAVRGTLRVGDYSVAGFEARIALERKSFDDLVGCCTHDRDRFERQVQRLGSLEYGALVIEEDQAAILAGHDLSHVDPASVLNTLISWSVRYRVPVWLCSGRERARATVYRLLWHFVRAATREIPAEEDGLGEVRCRRCRRKLTDPESRRLGVGPTCHEKEIIEGAVVTEELVA